MVALTVFAALLIALSGDVAETALGFVFSPAMALAMWRGSPIIALLSPLASQLAQLGVFAAAFDGVLLLIAGRYVERALGGVGLLALYGAGSYGGALARLLLTPGSATPGFSASGALFAIVGGYLMLYGVPRGLPVTVGRSRLQQVGALALLWALIQGAFALAGGALDLSVMLVEPLGGLAVGVAVSRPLLAWRWRGA